jgi:hypothetical protein
MQKPWFKKHFYKHIQYYFTKGGMVKDIKLHYVNKMYESKMSKHTPKVCQVVLSIQEKM